jgi:hypothetical protein
MNSVLELHIFTNHNTIQHNFLTHHICHINADYPRILEWTKFTYFKITIIQYRYIKYRVELSITIVFNFSNSQKAKFFKYFSDQFIKEFKE